MLLRPTLTHAIAVAGGVPTFGRVPWTKFRGIDLSESNS